MTLNIYRVLGAGAAAVMLSFAPARLALAQGCGSESDAHSREGWIGYRAGRLAEAEKRFRAAVGSCSADLDAVNGLGYVALRRGELRRADSLFALVVRRDSMNADGWTGAALTAQRSGATVRAAEAAARAAARSGKRDRARGARGDRPGLGAAGSDADAA